MYIREEKIRQRRRKKGKNHYFTKVHEEAIIRYTNTTCNREKTQLYEAYIQPAFSEMVDKITYTYKFTTLPNVHDLREECKIWLTTILGKYDPKKGSKAFSYFSVITKNWFIHKVKKNSTKIQREIHLDDVTKDLEEKYISSKNIYMEKREKDEFWDFLLRELKDWEKDALKNNSNSNDIRVLKAIRELLKEPEDVEILNKKAIYLYMREITGLNTKQIANSLKKFKIKYRSFKKEWIRGEI